MREESTVKPVNTIKIEQGKPLEIKVCPFCGVVVKKDLYIDHINECDARKGSN